MFVHPQFVGERHLLHHHPNLAAVAEARHAAIGRCKAQRDRNRRGFPRAVGAQQGQQFARLHLQIQPVQRPYFPEAFAHASQFR